jgi:vacuolar-type H+-ATPase subunit E/Vma4
VQTVCFQKKKKKKENQRQKRKERKQMALTNYLKVQRIIEESVERAFDMAQDTLDAMDRNQGNSDIRNVMTWLFLRDDEDPEIIELKNVESKALTLDLSRYADKESRNPSRYCFKEDKDREPAMG